MVFNQSCQHCSEDQKVNSCPQFKATSVTNRHHVVKGKRFCFDCLHPDHSSNDCESKFCCRECKMKHDTLPHRTQRPSDPPQVRDNGRNMFQESGSSASHKVSNSELTGLLKTDNQNNSVLLSTVVVSRRNASGKTFRMRARLDSGSSFYYCQHGAGPKKYSRYDYNTCFNTDPKDLWYLVDHNQ